MASRGTIPACPDCDSHRMYRIVRAGHNWTCQDCGGKFQSATKRPARSGRNGGMAKNTLARQLLDAEPDDVGGDA